MQGKSHLLQGGFVFENQVIVREKDTEVAMHDFLSQDLTLFDSTVIQQHLHVWDPLSELPPPVWKYSLHRRNTCYRSGVQCNMDYHKT